jgi:tryptophan synthase beta chain
LRRPSADHKTKTFRRNTMSDQIKYLLDESRMPKAWYNIAADLPVPLPPPLHPGTLQPLGPSDLAPIFPNAIIAQEMSTERYIDIPEPVREVLCQWRPSPLFRARRLEKLLGTPAKIYYKYEGVSRPAATSPTPPCPRPGTTPRKASSACPPKPVPASGARRWPTRAGCSGWT